MKKVLFVINTLGTGGAEKALLEMLEHLKGQDLSIDLYVLLGRGAQPEAGLRLCAGQRGTPCAGRTDRRLLPPQRTLGG